MKSTAKMLSLIIVIGILFTACAKNTEPESIVGYWVDQTTSGTYEFTEDGKLLIEGQDLSTLYEVNDNIITIFQKGITEENQKDQFTYGFTDGTLIITDSSGAPMLTLDPGTAPAVDAE